jgi:tripartite-type tricarboxylate transporter receptor subunit TctC
MTRINWTAFLLAALMSAAAGAQQYPTKTVRLIVGFPPVGGTDIVSRLLAQRLTETWMQQFIVDNRPGATGMIGANLVAKAPPDGYTLLTGHVNSNAIAPWMVHKALYDPLTDFAPIAYIGYAPNVLVVHPSTPARNVKELIALAKAHPGELTFASPGIGSTNHLAGEMFMRATGIKLTHIPYKGSSPAIIDILAGHVVMNFDTLSSVAVYLKQGRMRPLAVTTAARDPQIPHVPTLREIGLKEYDVRNWYSVMGPAGTPRDVVVKLNAEVNRILQLPEVRTRIDELGVRLDPMTPEQFAEFVRKENIKYQRVAKETGIRME